MLTIIYDAEKGEAIPDGLTKKYVDRFVLQAKDLPANLVTTVSSSLVVDEFRLRVVRGEIHPKAIKFVFEGKDIWVEDDGRLASWPLGFCDHVSNTLREIAQAKRERNKAL
jgi:hypothetical protein